MLIILIYVLCFTFKKGTSSNLQNIEKNDFSIFNFYPSKIDPRKNLFIPTDAHDQGASF